ncbi:MAG: hypothetical protein HYX77_08525 [Acidobacteria bacterium]|nr:hypothetical protein [Acidobacteriota bacterium]
MTRQASSRRPLTLTIAGALLILSGPVVRPGGVQGQGRPVQAGRPEVRIAARHDTSKPLAALPQLPPRAVGAVLRRRLLPHRIGSEGATGDEVLQGEAIAAGVPTQAQNFEGVHNVNQVLPPDPTGDIGPHHYVQMVNLSFAVFDRTGNVLYGPADNRTLWQGFGGPCEATNDGDPIVLYDQIADRWMLSQFALPNFPKGPFYQCIAVSQTGDPTGAYHRYEFMISETAVNDYPKFGIWPDAYYMAVNQFSCYPIFCEWAGQGAVAFEREQMLNGGAARMIYFDLYGDDPTLGGMLPADLDGPLPPPAGAPNPFCQVDDDAWLYAPGDQLQCWGFGVNWSNPALSTFGVAAVLPAAAFDSNLCLYDRNCIPQPDTGTRVDALSDRLMYRLQYRNFGTHEALVANHTVDATGADRAAIRWYELRNYGSGWGIHQQGTYSPDYHHRWMGSVAMNRAGDIALGYSISSGSVYPSIRATGRFAGDAPGVMTQGEVVIAEGSGHQTHTSGRWGDYSTLSVDPTDDCTFWYTQEYYEAKGTAPWQTRIGAFRMRDCESAGPPTSDAPGTTHVGDLDRSSIGQRNVWTARVTIAIHGSHHDAISEADVTGMWSDGTSGTASCTTTAAGQCTVEKAGLRKNLRRVRFTVTGITYSSLAYDSTGNHDPDGDSAGTSITVLKP